MNKFYKDYISNINKLLKKTELVKISRLEELIQDTSKNGKKVIICGNGGSAATASHVAIDLTKNANIRAINFNEYDLITCFSNDFGYENWVKKSIEYYADEGDLLILLSCSGNSKNLVNAQKKAASMGLKIAILTGLKKNNKLNNSKNNDIKIWINSSSYNYIEIIHHFILLMIIDKIIDKKKSKSPSQKSNK